MKAQLRIILVATALILAFGGHAQANTIGPNCGSCFGATYSLTYNPTPVSTTSTTQTFAVTYTINTTGYNGGGTLLDAVAIKVASASSFVSAALFSAPTAFWSIGSGHNTGSSACGGSSNGFACASTNALAGHGLSVPGGTFTWVFDIKVLKGTLFTALNGASISARYVVLSTSTKHGVTTTTIKSQGIVSENISLTPPVTPVPEPGSLALFGTGLMGFAGIFRRKLMG